MSDAKTSSFRLPDGETHDVTFVRLPGGRVVARKPDELVKRPTPPPAK